MSLATDLIILYSEKMVGRDHPSLPRTMEKLALALSSSGLGTNLIKNGSFESFSLGTSNQPPDGFAKIGAPTDVSQDTGERDGYGGTNAVKITSNGAGNEGITITLSNLKASTEYALTIRAKATAADTARIWTTGGSANLDKNTASTSFVDIEGTFTTDGTPTNVVLNMGSDTATDIVWFDKLMIQEGEVPALFSLHPNDQHLKAVSYQDNTPTNFVYGDMRVETGLAVPVGAGTSLDRTVTFGTAFSKVLGVVVITSDQRINVAAVSLTVSGFIVRIGRGTEADITAFSGGVPCYWWSWGIN